jgi:hypothetical protein
MDPRAGNEKNAYDLAGIKTPDIQEEENRFLQ